MSHYATRIMLQGSCIWADTVEASSPAEARKIAESHFWSGARELREALPHMTALEREHSERFLALMEETRASALQHGITTTARPSRAK